MEIGFRLPGRGPLANAEAIRTLAIRGEELGYACVTLPDHIVLPSRYEELYPYADDGRYPGIETGECLDQPTLLAYVAAITTKPRLLTSVMVVPLRPAVVTAKMLATIDVLSDGRLVLGCGAGWLKEEFEALGAPPHAERGRATNEYIRAFKELWTKDRPNFEGDHVKFSDIIFEPKPVQKPHQPIWIGGESASALRRVVELGDGWFPIGINASTPLDTRDRYTAGLQKLHAAAEAHDRDPQTIALAYWAIWTGLDVPLTASDGTRRLFSGSVDEISGDVDYFRELGVTTLIVDFLSPADDSERTLTLHLALDRMERYAEQVLPLAGR